MWCRPGVGASVNPPRIRFGACDPFRARAGYTPDQLVEMLLPLLWLCHSTGMPGNLCVDGSMVLHYAYEHFGISAEPKAVDLVVSNRCTEQRTLYGRICRASRRGIPTRNPTD